MLMHATDCDIAIEFTSFYKVVRPYFASTQMPDVVI